MKSIYIEIREKNSRSYPCLVADLGYTQRVISYDRALIYEVSPVPVAEMLNAPVGNKYFLLGGNVNA